MPSITQHGVRRTQPQGHGDGGALSEFRGHDDGAAVGSGDFGGVGQAQTGAQHGARSPERVTYRNGYRNRTWDTRVGTMELHISRQLNAKQRSTMRRLSAMQPA